MTDRRQFLRRLGGLTGTAALAELTGVRNLFAADLGRSAGRIGSRRDAGALAGEYLLGRDVVYLNHASIGTIPRIVHQARQRYLDLCETNPWLYMWHDAWESTRTEVRDKVAALLRCGADEVAITHNTTEGFNTLAHGLPLGPGDEVLFSTLNHPGASICWRHVGRRRGYSVKQFEFPIAAVPGMTAAQVIDTYLRHIGPRTRVLAFSHIDNTVGLRYPMRDLALAAKARGVEFVAVDGAQSVGMIPVDLSDGAVDFYAASPHKWLQAPKGLGLLYVSAAAQDRLDPMWVTWGQAQWKGTARIYEDYGTRNLPELVTLGDAIDFQQRLGEAAKESRYRAMWQRMRQAVDAHPRMVWRSPTDWALSSSVYAIEVTGVESGALFERLVRDHGMTFRAFSTPAFTSSRISPNLNTPAAHLDRWLELAAG
jgi:selenocysteine lyase/cysteine desulfurase